MEAAYGDVEAIVVRVVDGDTLIVNIPTLPPVVGEQIGIRLSGCDTPELHDKRPEIRALALKAKEYVNSLLLGRTVMLKKIRRGKYFRLIANIEIQQTDLSYILINKGLAKQYDGGKKSW